MHSPRWSTTGPDDTMLHSRHDHIMLQLNVNTKKSLEAKISHQKESKARGSSSGGEMGSMTFSSGVQVDESVKCHRVLPVFVSTN